MYKYFAYMYIKHIEDRTGWWMWDTMWVIGTEPESLAKATSAHNCWATSLVLEEVFFFFCCFVLVFFWDKESLYRLGYSQTLNSPASASLELGL